MCHSLFETQKEVDMICAALSSNYERAQVMTFTLLPYFVEYMGFLYKKPDPRTNLFWNFLGPLKLNVWLAIIASMAIVAVAVKITGKGEGVFSSTRDAFWFSFGALLQRGKQS
jgi:hypothetical protein